jgi:ubiquinone/menaquinone biosynthesis C-methylase UbiE
MGLGDWLLYRVARNWRSPLSADRPSPGVSDADDLAYAQEQFDQRIRQGLGVSVFDRDVLEIGCGHGGISCFLAVAGARSVVGIDLNVRSLRFAQLFADRLGERLGSARLPLSFREMSAYEMDFPPDSFDLVVADNAFEHFMDPEEVLRQAFRVLRPQGRLLAPIFSSIYSKHGLHLKRGLKMPWANLLFSEQTIVRAMHRLAAERPELLDAYPGLKDSPRCVRDLRPYKDLNDITYGKFRRMAQQVGFRIEWMRLVPTRLGKIVERTPLVRRSILADIFSVGSAACLRKPAAN